MRPCFALLPSVVHSHAVVPILPAVCPLVFGVWRVWRGSHLATEQCKPTACWHRREQGCYWGLLALLLGLTRNRKLLGAPGIAMNGANGFLNKVFCRASSRWRFCLASRSCRSEPMPTDVEQMKRKAPSSFLFLVTRMLLVVRPGAPSSVLAPSSDALCSW